MLIATTRCTRELRKKQRKEIMLFCHLILNHLTPSCSAIRFTMSTSKQADSRRDLRELTRDFVELDGDILLLCWDNLLEESWEMLWNWSTLSTSEEWIWDRARGLKVLWEEVVSLFWKKTNFLKRQPSLWKELCIKTHTYTNTYKYYKCTWV